MLTLLQVSNLSWDMLVVGLGTLAVLQQWYCIMFINNNTVMIQSNVVTDGVDVVHVTDTWVRKGETVSLKEITPLTKPLSWSFINLKGPWGKDRCAHLGVFLLQDNPDLRDLWYWSYMCGIECWEEVYLLPCTLANIQPNFTEAEWALRYSRLIVMGDFNIHEGTVSSSFQVLNGSWFVNRAHHKPWTEPHCIFPDVSHFSNPFLFTTISHHEPHKPSTISWRVIKWE